MVLLLTGCIDPQGMAYTALNNPEIRKRQYLDAIKWYLVNTTLPILFVENSNNDISDEFKTYINDGRLEIITFDGNNFDKSLGKGYGEAQIMQYAFEHSLLLQHDTIVVKVTGRLICRNINTIVCKYNSSDTVFANIGKDDWGGDIAGSSFVIAPSQFWKGFFLPRREELNDSKRFHFEHLLYESICQWKRKGMRHQEFWTLPQTEGVSGTSGTSFCGIDKRSLAEKIMYLLHKLGYRGYMNPFYKGDKSYEINYDYRKKRIDARSVLKSERNNFLP